MVLGLLEGHIQTHHERVAEGRWCREATAYGKETWTYRMAFPTAGGTMELPS